MNSYKRILAGTLALGMVFGMTACGKDGDSKGSDDSFEATNKVEVQASDKISAIPEESEGTIIYLGEGDLNPTKKNPEKSTELNLFEQKGGKITFQQTSNEDRFDNLAAAITANKDVPDIFKYEWLAFPSQVVREMYQPIDDIVDFNSDLWSPAKETADQFMLGGKHYVAPLGYLASSMLCYDRDLIDAEGLEVPYDLYKNGEWTWSAWKDIMSEYVSNAPADTDRYGVNGFFRTHLVQQTGKNLINYNADKGIFESNLKDPDIEKGQDFLYDLMKEGLILNGWVGSARDCFNQNCLFFAMGDWAYSGTSGPKEGENWEIVPIPAYDSNPQKITTSDMTAFMWVKGSTKNDAVKTWFECCRVANTDPQYAETAKSKFMENNPNWTDEMYDVKMDVVSDDYMMIFDYAFGVSSALGDRKQFDGNQCLVDYLYAAASTQDEEGNQPTWGSVREEYSATVDSELKDLNSRLEAFNAK